MSLREKVQKHPQPGRVPFTNKKHSAVSGVFLLPTKNTPPLERGVWQNVNLFGVYHFGARDITFLI